MISILKNNYIRNFKQKVNFYATKHFFLSQGYPLLVTKEKGEDVAHTKSSLQKKWTVITEVFFFLNMTHINVNTSEVNHCLYYCLGL